MKKRILYVMRIATYPPIEKFFEFEPTIQELKESIETHCLELDPSEVESYRKQVLKAIDDGWVKMTTHDLFSK